MDTEAYIPVAFPPDTVQTQHPQTDNQWLVVNFRVRNNTSQTFYINWYLGDIVTYVSPDGTAHDMDVYVTDYGVNALPTAYAPGQTQEGYVYIQVPATEDVTKGKLRFHFELDACEFVMDMAGLPTFTYSQ